MNVIPALGNVILALGNVIPALGNFNAGFNMKGQARE